jgi:hypothetical protein
MARAAGEVAVPKFRLMTLLPASETPAAKREEAPPFNESVKVALLTTNALELELL